MTYWMEYKDLKILRLQFNFLDLQRYATPTPNPTPIPDKKYTYIENKHEIE